ncbi:hypothetical protein SLE2022_275120 [Rubroshorea leprosula]
MASVWTVSQPMSGGDGEYGRAQNSIFQKGGVEAVKALIQESLPPDRQYFAAGVLGRFHSQFFPRASLRFIHSSYSLHWLSSTPKELKEINKGSIYYHRGSKEFVEAYSAQFARDMESFLAARAEEVVVGGLMTLLLLCLPGGYLPSMLLFVFTILLEASLLDMVNMGFISEEQPNDKHLIELFFLLKCNIN